jgi:hypothetical protein
MVGLALVCIGAISLDLSRGGVVSFAWPVVTSFGSAAILWATALWRVRWGYAQLRHALRIERAYRTDRGYCEVLPKMPDTDRLAEDGVRVTV